MGDITEDLDAKGGALSTAKDLFAGAVGGIAQVLVGKVTIYFFSSYTGIPVLPSGVSERREETW